MQQTNRQRPNHIHPDDAALLGAFGITMTRDLFSPVVKKEKNGDISIQFMSSGGLSDARQGEEFKTFLTSKNLDHTRLTSRCFKLDQKELEEACGFKVL